MLLEIFCCGPALTNCLLIGCPETRQGVIVDAPFDVTDQLVARIDELKLNVKTLLLTHSHWDHIAEAALLKKKLALSVSIHPLDAPNLRLPGADGLPLWREVKGMEPDHLLEDGEKITIGKLQLEVIHTPGHSPGSVCFYFADDATLVSGDTLFKGSIGNISFPTSDAENMWQSLEKLAKLPKETRVFPGHGDETTIGAEHWLAHAREYFS